MAQIIRQGEKAYALAVQILRAGGIIALPTETVYGLAVLAAGREDLYILKNRDKSKPLPHIVLDPAHVTNLCKTNALADDLIRDFWPGPLTLVLPEKDGPGTLALRCPDIGWRVDFLAMGMSGPLLLTSANISGRAELNSAQEINAEFGDKIKLIIDGGPPKAKRASTIIKISGKTARLLRPGALAPEKLANIKLEL